MRLGLSLPPAYLAGESDRWLGEALGPPTRALAELREQGVDAVELRAIGSATHPAMAVQAAHVVWQAGLTLTVHGQLPAPTTAPAPLSAALLAVAREATPRQPGLCVTLHAYQSSEETTEVLAQRTVGALGDWLRQATTEGVVLRFALELNRAKGVHDPGATYAGLLEMQSQVGDERLGFCWDLGHTCANVRRKVLTIPAPDAFVRRVIHTHIHAVSSGGQTHWPLTAGELPLEECLAALAAADYDGILNLELDPERFATQVNVRSAILGSLARLRQARSGVGTARDASARR